MNEILLGFQYLTDITMAPGHGHRQTSLTDLYWVTPFEDGGPQHLYGDEVCLPCFYYEMFLGCSPEPKSAAILINIQQF